MRLRPRYSLLTLFLLTALVAGGVKWWHGPHRVVERTSAAEEYEYTYTRNWHGEKTVSAPVLRRQFARGKLQQVLVYFYRDNALVGPTNFILVDWPRQQYFVHEWSQATDLSPEEHAAYTQALRDEIAPFREAGFRFDPQLFPHRTRLD